MIKKVEQLPDSAVDIRVSRREWLRADLKAAHEAGVGTYELTGDYNFSYLRQYAREQEDYLFRKWFYDFSRKHAAVWKERYEQKYIFLNDWEFRKMDNLVVHQVKGKTPDEKPRVFVEITMTEEEMEQKILAACEKKLEEHQRQDREQAEEEKRKKLKMVADDENETISFAEDIHEEDLLP